MTTVISIKIDCKTEQQIRRITKNLNITLDDLVNSYLRWLIENRSIFIDRKHKSSLDFLISALEEAFAVRPQGKNFIF